jgi:hypothetical protein
MLLDVGTIEGSITMEQNDDSIKIYGVPSMKISGR